MQGNNTFTSTTAQQICMLLDRQSGLDSVEQLKISNELKALGFCIDDFVDNLPNYDPLRGVTSYNFDWLVDDRRIVIID
jgi:hypothetical protein